MDSHSNNSSAGSQPGALPTPHNNYRADGLHFTKGRGRYKSPRYIIVHSSVGKDSRNWLTTTSPPPNNVSAHVLVQGNDRYNLVDFLDTAYAAGTCLSGISNADTLNIEIENLSGYVYPNNGTVVNEPYSEATLNNAAHCVAAWCFSYGIPLAGVRRHADVAVYPDDYEDVALRGKLGRKHDPINLDWHDFMNRVQAWLTFFATLDEKDHAYFIQLAPTPFDPYPIIHAPTIAPVVFSGQLKRRNSPVLAETSGETFHNIIASYGIDPNIGLGFFGKESEFGTYEHAGANKAGVPLNKVAMRGARNWGNLRPNPDVSQPPGGRATHRVNSDAYGLFCGYESWQDGLRDWCEKLLGPLYKGKTLIAVLEVYAPKSDGNDPAAYAKTLQEWAALWAEASNHS
jgi:N-acetyl-anhydromuramyl-L-alanine amidase AmpD